MLGMLTDVGNVRKNNEDYIDVFSDDEKSLYIIADGMGGYNAGEVASSIAAKSVIEYIKDLKKIDEAENILKQAIEYANTEVYNASIEDEKYKGMGTTITACLVMGLKMIVGHVGDSSCFILKQDKLVKVTKDHSLVQQLLDTGSITEEEALTHPNKNVITRALGTNAYVKVDIFTVQLQESERVILCTDGLSNSVNLDEMYNILINNDNIQSCIELVKLSKVNGSRDNISVIVFEGEGKK